MVGAGLDIVDVLLRAALEDETSCKHGKMVDHVVFESLYLWTTGRPRTTFSHSEQLRACLLAGI